MNKRLVVVDVEADGPVPGLFSMVCFGAVIVDDKLDKTFYGQVKPITEQFNPSSLAISGFSREVHLTFNEPVDVMYQFKDWLIVNGVTKPLLVSDNPGFDAAYMNYYFHRYVGSNPFGWSSRRIGDLFCGFKQDAMYKWKKHRVTKHTHNPVDDAMGNAEALQSLKRMGLKNLF